MSAVVVTGAAGFIGQSIVRKLQATGYDVVEIDLATPSPANPSPANPSSARHLVLDLLDQPALDRLFEKTRPQAVVHAAGIVGMAAADVQPSRTVAVNVLGTQYLLEAMNRHRTRSLVHLSTQDVYGHFMSSLIDEEHPRAPISLYGTTKLMAELLLEQVCRTSDLRICCLRPAWVYGPGMAEGKFPRAVIEAAASSGNIRLAHGAASLVDMIHVEDLARLVAAALECRLQGFVALNAASGVAHSVAAVCKLIAAQMGGLPVEVGPGRLRTGFSYEVPRQGALAIDRSSALLGCVPKIKLEQGIHSVLVEPDSWANQPPSGSLTR